MCVAKTKWHCNDENINLEESNFVYLSMRRIATHDMI